MKQGGILERSYREAWEDEDTLADLSKHLPEFLAAQPHLIGVVALDASGRSVGGAIACQAPRNFVTDTAAGATLEGLLVDTPYRRQGVGTKLVDAVLRHFGTIDDPELPDKHTLSFYGDRSAEKFYRSIGARYTGERRLKGLKSAERRHAVLARLAQMRSWSTLRIAKVEPAEVYVRRADLDDIEDRRTLIGHELAGRSYSEAAASRAAQFIDAVEHAAGFIAEVDGQTAGSVLVHEWPHNYAKGTSDVDKRNDLVAAAIYGPQDTGALSLSLRSCAPLQSKVILALLQRLVEHAETTGHTQITIDHASPETTELLDACEFVNGLKLELRSAMKPSSSKS